MTSYEVEFRSPSNPTWRPVAQEQSTGFQTLTEAEDWYKEYCVLNSISSGYDIRFVKVTKTEEYVTQT